MYSVVKADESNQHEYIHWYVHHHHPLHASMLLICHVDITHNLSHVIHRTLQPGFIPQPSNHILQMVTPYSCLHYINTYTSHFDHKQHPSLFPSNTFPNLPLSWHIITVLPLSWYFLLQYLVLRNHSLHSWHKAHSCLHTTRVNFLEAPWPLILFGMVSLLQSNGP